MCSDFGVGAKVGLTPFWNSQKSPTHVASKWPYLLVICSLLGVVSSSWKLLQLLQRMSCHVLAMVYLQQFTCNGQLAMLVFILRKIIITSSQQRDYIKAHEILRLLVKTVKIGDIKESQVKCSACLNFCCKPSQAIRTSNRKSISVK